MWLWGFIVQRVRAPPQQQKLHIVHLRQWVEGVQKISEKMIKVAEKKSQHIEVHSSLFVSFAKSGKMCYFKML